MAKHSTVRRTKRESNDSEISKGKRHSKDVSAKKNFKDASSHLKCINMSRQSLNFRPWQWLLMALGAVMCSVLNSYHQSSMFENYRHFSHLSSLEREMTFRTEMGLYYNYFKVLVEAPSFSEGLQQITNDNLTEYPSVINTLERFNLYPEVFLGASYRGLTQMADFLGIPIKECWKVLRGGELPPIESCEGMGDPAMFYTTCVFLFNGMVGALMFLYGTFLSDSMIGGVISSAFFFFNHGECTRVQWTPPLRESFGYPVFLLQMLTVTLIIRHGKPKPEGSIIAGALTSIFISFWQFAQFALLTQILAVFGIYVLNLCNPRTLQTIVKGQLAGLVVALAFLFGNKMLLTSLYSSSLIVILIISIFHKQFEKISAGLLRIIVYGAVLCVGVMGVKITLSFVFQVHDDAHIWNLLRSKFTSYMDFHTMLYTCANEFDFLDVETYLKLTKTLLIPTSVIAIIAVVIQIIRTAMQSHNHDSQNNGDVVYNVFQLIAFYIMAALIMRLKLFFTPHLCLVASLVISKRYLKFLSKPQYQYAVAAVILSVMAVQGMKNIKEQRNIVGEFSDPNTEELFTWIRTSTPPDSVFAGPMPTMANLLLSTRRPIVNHPHYENSEARNRTYQVYKIFSRKPAEEVYNVLSELKVDFMIIKRDWCFGKSREGCAMVDLWDIEDKLNLKNPPLCQRLIKESPPFFKVFQNAEFTVLKL